MPNMHPSRPQWYETLAGMAIIAASAWYFSHLLHHPDQNHPWYAWAAGGGFLTVGMLIAWPRRTMWLLDQVRDAVPFLEDTHSHEE